jgi:perosamine synthetase
VTFTPVTRPDYLPFGKPHFSDGEIAAVARVLRSGWVGMGPESIAFEGELAAFLGAPHVISVNSCTAALFLALLAHGIGPGDEVICPSLTWCATANVAIYLGATPVFCDVDPGSLCVTPETIAAKLTKRTKAVMIVHFGGLAADVEAIRGAVPGSVALIEDAAHALGARFDGGRSVGASGNITCFSFYANKNLSTGEGGAIALFDGEVAVRLRSLRQNGMSADAWKRFSHPDVALVAGPAEVGYKLNFTDLGAAIGRVQLARQAEFAERRRSIVGIYCEGLARPDCRLRFQDRIDDSHHARHLCVVSLDPETCSMTRDEFVLALRARNIGASIHYPPLHQMSIYRQFGGAALPVTDDLSKRIVTLPISASMTLPDAEDVVGVVRDLLRC